MLQVTFCVKTPIPGKVGAGRSIISNNFVTWEVKCRRQPAHEGLRINAAVSRMGRPRKIFLEIFYATRLTSSTRHGATQSGGSRTGPTQIGGHLPSSGQHNLKGTLTVPLALHSLQRRCQGHRR